MGRAMRAAVVVAVVAFALVFSGGDAMATQEDVSAADEHVFGLTFEDSTAFLEENGRHTAPLIAALISKCKSLVGKGAEFANNKVDQAADMANRKVDQASELANRKVDQAQNMANRKVDQAAAKRKMKIHGRRLLHKPDEMLLLGEDGQVSRRKARK